MLELHPPRPKKKICSRLIHSSVYERRCPADDIWWKNLFKSLEDDSKVPAHRRKKTIHNVFHDKVAQRIMAILSFDEPFNIVKDIKYNDGQPLIYSSDTTTPDVLRPISLHRLGHRKSSEVIDSPSQRYKSRNVGRNNPYLNFFKRRPDRAAIWRELPPLALDEMNLTQKADAITEQIASDFVGWLKTIGGDVQKASLDVDTIKNMFGIGFTLHAATSLSVKIKEMPSVTKEVALKRKLPQASIRANLRKQLKRDIIASTAKDSNIAFGKVLPKSLRCYRLKEDIYHKWIESTKIPHDLATMAAVWQGIEGLRSTRAFCAFLADHPEAPEPEYLKSMGMLTRTFYENTRFSQDTVDFKAGLAGIETGALTVAEYHEK